MSRSGPPKQRRFSRSALVLGLGSVCCGACSHHPGAAPPATAPIVGELSSAPVVRAVLPRLGGGQVSFIALRGKPVVVFLFTTWSLRAQLEAPQLAQLHDRNRRIHVVGIALDRGQQVQLLVRTFVDYVSFGFDVALAQPDDAELLSSFGPTLHVPRTVLLDQAGRPVQDHQGQTDFARLFSGIRRLLGSAKTDR